MAREHYVDTVAERLVKNPPKTGLNPQPTINPDKVMSESMKAVQTGPWSGGPDKK